MILPSSFFSRRDITPDTLLASTFFTVVVPRFSQWILDTLYARRSKCSLKDQGYPIVNHRKFIDVKRMTT
jgi:hypothetical protein